MFNGIFLEIHFFDQEKIVVHFIRKYLYSWRVQVLSLPSSLWKFNHGATCAAFPGILDRYEPPNYDIQVIHSNCSSIQASGFDSM